MSVGEVEEQEGYALFESRHSLRSKQELDCSRVAWSGCCRRGGGWDLLVLLLYLLNGWVGGLEVLRLGLRL